MPRRRICRRRRGHVDRSKSSEYLQLALANNEIEIELCIYFIIEYLLLLGLRLLLLLQSHSG